MLDIVDLKLSIGSSPILNGVTFQVKAGEQVGIIGPNGSGKTTLFNSISGFLPVSSGSISFLDSDITHLPAHERAQLGVGRVFQNFGIFREMTVLENIISALENRAKGLYFPWSKEHRAFREKAREFLNMVGLAGKANEKAASLSGGQMRLLEIVRCIAYEAQLFLLDEPTAGVSPKMKGEVEGIVKELRKLGKTFLMIEHDLHFIQKLCERIVVLDVGKVVLDGTPESVRTNPMLQEIYFGGNGAAA